MADKGLVFAPLGGAGEIGLNNYVYGLDGRWLQVDFGLTFADDTHPGVDLVLPDLSWLEARREALEGIVLTHAHEDHLGAVPYLWPRLGAPIYCTRFTAAVLRKKLAEARMLGQVPIREVKPGERFTLGPFTCFFVGVTHSIPDANALAIETRHGLLVHSGDWKLDPEPLVGPVTNVEGFSELGARGVLALICDSTNIMTPGTSGSEAEVRDSLTKLIAEQPNRVALTTFASNIARLESAIVAANAAGRDVVVVGRSMHRMIEAAKECGYLRDIPELLPDKYIDALPRSKTLLLCTGCQGEARAALGRIASGNHPTVELEPGDTVIFSSKIIPGNERTLYNLHNRLVLAGLEVITEQDHFVHVSGHPSRDEVEQMYRWLRPQIAIPVHGEIRHLHEHRAFAERMGVQHAIQVVNGDMVRLAPGEPERLDRVGVGRAVIESSAFVPAEDDLYRVRRRLANHGTVLVSLVMDDAGSLVADPNLSVIGASAIEDDDDAMAALVEAIGDAIDGLDDWQAEDDERVRDTVRTVARRGLQLARDKRPIIEVQITRLSAEVLNGLIEEAGVME